MQVLTHLNLRRLVPSDAMTIAEWMVREDCLHPKLMPEIATALSPLLEQGRMQGMAIENVSPTITTLAALGLSGFAEQAELYRHLEHASPFLFARLLLNARSRVAFLDKKRVARDSAIGGLNLIAHLMIGRWDFGDPKWREVGVMAHHAYVRDHRGFRINRIFQEDWARPQDIYIATGYSVKRAFSAATTCDVGPSLKTTRNLYFAEAVGVATSAPGSSISFVMQWQPPILNLTFAEQRVLMLACDSFTDEQISSATGLSLNTIKSQWRSIFNKVEFRASDVLPKAIRSTGPTRGRELRRTVVAYVSRHPEELRPYARRP